MTLRDDLIRDEGIRLTAYQDSEDYWTIGVGRLIDSRRGGGISQAEAMMLLDNDIARVEAELDHTYPWWRSRPGWVQRGMANCAFQLGLHGLGTFRRMLSCLQAGDYQGAQEAARDSLWARQTPARAARVIALFSDQEPGKESDHGNEAVLAV